jgi:branched-chain amino acid aminotransferase
VSKVWVDGRIVPADQPQLRVTDRGFQLGDGIFETLRARRAVPIEWDEHIARLHESAVVLGIPLPATVGDRLLEAIRGLLEANGLTEDASLRITVTRGSLERRGLLPPGWEVADPTIVVQAFPFVPPPAELLERGVRAITSSVRRDVRSPLAGAKSTSRADHVFAKIEAERAGVDDAIFLTGEGMVSEATTANVFALLGDRLVTPPLSAAILAGTTRTWLLSQADEAIGGLVAEEGELSPGDLAAADEAFLSSSVAGVVPLVELDGRPIGGGRPGPRTLALREARDAWIEDAARAGAR